MRTLPLLAFTLITTVCCGLARAESRAPGIFRVWVFADAHVDTDKRNGRESLATALRQSESAAGFEWDIALDLGDLSGAQGTPKDEEGQEIVRQFNVLGRHSRKAKRKAKKGKAKKGQVAIVIIHYLLLGVFVSRAQPVAKTIK